MARRVFARVIPSLTGDADRAQLAVDFLDERAPDIGRVSGAVLRAFREPAVVVYDPVTEQVIGTIDPAQVNAIESVLTPLAEAVFVPTDGILGRVLLWDRMDEVNDTWGPDAGLDLIDKPRRTPYSVGSLVQRVLSSRPPGAAMPWIVIDQIANGGAGNVRIFATANDAAASSALRTLTVPVGQIGLAIHRNPWTPRL